MRAAVGARRHRSIHPRSVHACTHGTWAGSLRAAVPWPTCCVGAWPHPLSRPSPLLYLDLPLCPQCPHLGPHTARAPLYTAPSAPNPSRPALTLAPSPPCRPACCAHVRPTNQPVYRQHAGLLQRAGQEPAAVLQKDGAAGPVVWGTSGQAAARPGRRRRRRDLGVLSTCRVQRSAAAAPSVGLHLPFKPGYCVHNHMNILRWSSSSFSRRLPGALQMLAAVRYCVRWAVAEYCEEAAALAALPGCA